MQPIMFCHTRPLLRNVGFVCFFLVLRLSSGAHRKLRSDESEVSTLHSGHPACDDVVVSSDDGEVPLRARTGVPAEGVRVVDFIQFGSAHELPELHLRLREMGEFVDEIHVAEGDRTAGGESKEYAFPSLLQHDAELGKFRNKIVYHKVSIPQSIKEPYALQEAVIKAKKAIPASKNAVLVEGDLDEIVNRKVLRAVRHCVPKDSGKWDANVRMNIYAYNLGWTKGKWKWPPVIHDLDQGGGWNLPGVSFMQYVFRRSNEVYLKHGQAGWHLNSMLDGADGLAYKYLNYPYMPNWANGHAQSQATLAKFIREQVLPHPDRYDQKLKPSNLSKQDLPEAIVEDPEMFRELLGNVKV